ncbi:allatostatin-A receptor-like [Neocloeon triangulifer]|uniref:allatostatin-A receptor-like n=1 Tax=Neocloeon triangulifer TaxID=2078957 RepID=UPI00286F6EFD|nr:allatostatin-A receptor-like [Neocloeon triangulifer]
MKERFKFLPLLLVVFARPSHQQLSPELLAKWNMTLNDTLLLLKNLEFPPLEIFDSMVAQGVLIGLYSVTGVAALLLNALQIYILLTGQRSSVGALRPYLINVSCADMLMAIFSIPFTYTHFMLGRWIFPPSWCPVVLYMQQVSVVVSVYTLVAMGFDRYRAIVHPMRLQIGRKRARRCIFSIWTLTLAASAHIFWITKAVPFRYNRQKLYDCAEQWDPQSKISQVYTFVVFGATFGLPLALLLWAYSVTSWTLWFSHKAPRVQIANENDSNRMKNRVKVFKISVAIVVSFVVCWLPLQTFVLLYYSLPEFRVYLSDFHKNVYGIAYFCCHYLACVNSCINPLLYCFMNKNFREDLADLCYSRILCRSRVERRSSTSRKFSASRKNSNNSRVRFSARSSSSNVRFDSTVV